jgi:hypothetical protein
MDENPYKAPAAFSIGGVSMGNGERSDSGGRSDWPVRLAGAAGGAAGMAVSMLVGNLVDLRGFWPGLIAVVIGVGAGVTLGRLVGALLFRPSSGGPRDHPPYV